MSFGGIFLGAATFLLIGACHPLVIHAEYRWGRSSWWMFLVVGILLAIASLLAHDFLLSAVLGAAAFSFFWGILEVFEQEKRVLKGWFPENPQRHDYYEAQREALREKQQSKKKK